MLSWIRRHPLSIRADLEHLLVLAYAVPGKVLTRFLPPGLELDTYEGHGFLAIAMVQTRALRPAPLPAFLGRDFFLTGYRIFTRYRTRSGRSLRGLLILRSDTDRRAMARIGNLVTHYGYRAARVRWEAGPGQLEVEVATPGAEADLHVVAELGSMPAPLPDGSPFPDLETARRFAGPLPYTFAYEPESRSMLRVRGVRRDWKPTPVAVSVSRCTFLEREPFRGAPARLANAFYLPAVPYRWDRGICERLEPRPA